jgi:integrase
MVRVLRMLQVRGGQGSEQRRQRAPHLAEVLQKLSVKRFTATSCNGLGTPGEGIRAGELAGIRYDPYDSRRSDVDLWRREITVRGKGGRPRVVRIGHEAARALDRYLRIRARHEQAHRPQLWLGVNNRGPVTANGIYQMIARRGRQCGVDAWTHRFRHHFSHTWLDRGGAEGDLMELNGWSSPQMLRRYGASARSARARRTYDRIMTDRP